MKNRTIYPSNYYCDLCGKRDRKRWVHESGFRLCEKWRFNDDYRSTIRKLIKRFGFNEVYIASEIAVDKYYKGTIHSWINTVEKLGGICYNRRKAAEENA